MAKKILWFLLFVILASSSCLNEPDCFRLNNNIIGISFKKEDGTASTATFVSIKAEGAEDTVFMATGNKVHLPLNFFQNNTSFYFEEANSTYILNVEYVAQAQYVSPDCGVRYVLSNVSIKNHTFDSLRLVSSIPKNNTSGNNIEIYFDN